MKWNTIQKLKPTDFRRRVGIKTATFEAMLKEVKRFNKKERQKQKKKNKKNAGPKHTCEPEDQLLMTLMYWREYRTMFHIATDYGISESTVSRIIQRTEDILKKSKKFTLPKRRKPSGKAIMYEVILIDATESPIERPKKTKKLLFRQKGKAYDKNTISC